MKKTIKGIVLICTLIFTLLVFSGAVFSEDDEPIISTVAGNGTGSEVFIEPHDAVRDSAGNLIIADTFNNRIVKINSDGTTETIVGGGGIFFPNDGDLGSDIQIISARSIEIDDSGNLYFHVLVAGKIFKMSPDGILTTFAGNGIQGANGDGGLATDAEVGDVLCMYFDDEGNFYFSQAGPFCVRKIDTNGIITTIAGTGVPGYSGDGGPATDAQVGLVFGIVKDDDSLYITDHTKHVIRRIDSEGVINLFAGSFSESGYSGDGGPATDAKFWGTADLVLDDSGNLYVSDYFNSVIRMISQDGIISTFAGTGIRGDVGDGGPATIAQLYYPMGINFDSDGNMLIGDTYNHSIRMIELAEKVTLKFNGNGSTSGLAPDFIEGEPGETVLLIETGTIEKTGFVFDGWSTTPGYDGIIYDPPASFTFGEEDTTLYARWIPADYQYTIMNGKVIINSYTGSKTDIMIPDTIESLPVVGIDSGAFASKSITSVTIPDSVIFIGSNAFAGNLLTNINFGSGLQRINEYAFSDNRLSSLNLPEGLSEIHEFAFSENQLGTITIPDSVTDIKRNAFAGIDHNDITFGSGFSKLWLTGGGKVMGHIAPPVDLVIPDSINHYDVFSIEAGAFLNVGYIESVHIPDGVRTIGAEAFRNNLLSEVTIPDTVTVIGDYAFFRNQLTNVIIPNDIRTIGYRVFIANTMNPVDFIIYGLAGTEAETHASEFGHTFMAKLLVRFVDWDGRLLKSEYVIPNSDAVPPTEPERTGYTFFEWDRDHTNVRYDLYVRATYTINQYTVTYESYNGPEVESVIQDYLTEVTEDPILKMSNYKFIGWYGDEEFTQEVIFPFILTKDVTLYARWIHCPDFNNKDKIMK